MNFPDDCIAHEQARVLGGLQHRYPRDNYSLVELHRVDVLLCAYALAGERLTHKDYEAAECCLVSPKTCFSAKEEAPMNSDLQDLIPYEALDSIEYELVNWETHELWHCKGSCGRYRHRRHVKGLLPAVCCGVAAQFMDKYEQPSLVIVEQPVSGTQ